LLRQVRWAYLSEVKNIISQSGNLDLSSSIIPELVMSDTRLELSISSV